MFCGPSLILICLGLMINKSFGIGMKSRMERSVANFLLSMHLKVVMPLGVQIKCEGSALEFIVRVQCSVFTNLLSRYLPRRQYY